MTDFYDRASEQEEMHRDFALQKLSRQMAAESRNVSDSAVECEDCDEPIPRARRVAAPGCRFCVECQKQREQSFYAR